MAAEETKERSWVRRDALQAIEVDVQKKWEEQKVFEVDAPTEGDHEKFFLTFPYPYMNGLLHIGHAFTLTKAIFAAHFQQLLGKKVLFPFAFHCTGMPIQAAANKLKREFEIYGENPIFPAGRPMPALKEGVPVLDGDFLPLSWKAPPHTGKIDIKAYHLQVSKAGGDFKEVSQVPQPDPATLKSKGNKVEFKAPIEDGTCVYKVLTELVNGKYGPESKESDELTIGVAAKDKKGNAAAGGKKVAKKILAKSGDAAFQWEILKSMDFAPDDIPPFTDPLHWLM
jgi:leucyl-tRNA synthetase